MGFSVEANYAFVFPNPTENALTGYNIQEVADQVAGDAEQSYQQVRNSSLHAEENTTVVYQREKPKRSTFKAFDAQRDIDRRMAVKTATELAQLLDMVDLNTERFIAEMCGLAVYEKTYELKDGKLYPQGSDEPMEVTIDKGCQAGLHSCNSEDMTRLFAEQRQWQTLQYLIAKEIRAQAIGITREPRTYALLSPRGKNSVFNANFIDFFTINEQGLIQLERRNSIFPAEGMAAVANAVSEIPRFTEHSTIPERKEAVVESRLPASVLYERFGTGSYRTSKQEWQTILTANDCARRRYRVGLAKMPPDQDELEQCEKVMIATTSAVLNKHYWIEDDTTMTEQDRFNYFAEMPLPYLLLAWGEVGSVPGFDSSFGFTDPALFNALDLLGFMPQLEAKDEGFGVDSKGSRKIYCADCNQTDARPLNKLVRIAP